MQGGGGLAGCMLQCSVGAPDSIEHYSNCTRLHAVTSAVLGLPRAALPEEPMRRLRARQVRLAEFLGLEARAGDDPEKAVCVAIRLKAAYHTHCVCRHGQVARGRAASEALWQACREAVRGHRRAERVYNLVRGWN